MQDRPRRSLGLFFLPFDPLHATEVRAPSPRIADPRRLRVFAHDKSARRSAADSRPGSSSINPPPFVYSKQTSEPASLSFAIQTKIQKPGVERSMIETNFIMFKIKLHDRRG
jgi:hypothetical protein